jgi:hypothetical protein
MAQSFGMIIKKRKKEEKGEKSLPTGEIFSRFSS